MELQPIQSKIYEIRGQRVMLDFDLAELYQVETKRLKEAVRRNIERFEGDDFMFVLSEKEYEILRTQIATSSLTSQNASSNWGGRRYMPFAFTEMGVAMLSSVLRSETAIRVNRAIMRAFVAMRNTLPPQPKSRQNWPKFGQNWHYWNELMQTMPKRSAICRRICARNSTISIRLSQHCRSKCHKPASPPSR